MEEIFLKMLIGQVRALDQFGTWANKSDEDILKEKYVKNLFINVTIVETFSRLNIDYNIILNTMFVRRKSNCH